MDGMMEKGGTELADVAEHPREAGGDTSAGGLPAQRFSAKRKLRAVRRLLRGEPLELVARELNVTAARLSEWRDRALLAAEAAPSVDVNFDPCRQHDFDTLIRAWLPLTYAVNSLNHSVGQPDLYPFVLAPQVMGKLRFVHGLVHPTALGAGPLRTPAG